MLVKQLFVCSAFQDGARVGHPGMRSVTIYTVSASPRISYTPFTLQTEAKRSEPKRSEANRTAESAPFTLAQNAQQCAFHNSLLSTLHTVECASFHTGSEAKRSALLSVVMGSAILVKAIHLVPFLSPSTSGLHARVP